MKFKLESVAVGTRDLPEIYEDVLLGLGEYVETAVEYNNDFLLKGKLPKSSKTIVRLHDISEDFLIANHLKYIGREKADILLVDSASVTSKEDVSRIRGFCESIGIFGSSLKPEDIEDFKKVTGYYPEYISVPVNPWNFRKDIFDKASKEGIKVIGYEIFGGPLQARTMLGTFGLQFLTRFAAYYCDIIVISSGANLSEEMILSKTLNDLAQDVEFFDETVYEMKKDSRKDIPVVSRLIHTYSEVSISGANHTFKNDNNDYMSPTEILLDARGNLEVIPVVDIDNLKESDNITYVTLGIMSDILKVKCTTWKEEVSPYYRYLIIGTLRNIYSEWRYKMKVSKIGDVFRITVSDRIKPWTKSLEYILYISERFDSGYNVFFRNL